MGIVLFSLVAAILVGSAIVVVAHPNPVFSALSLALNLTLFSLIYISLDATFLAISQIIVYAGAIVVLILFVLMLLNAKQEPTERNDIALLTASIAIGAALIAFLVPVARQSVEGAEWSTLVGSVSGLGKALFTEYLYPFQLAGVLLVVGVVGAVMLASQRKGGF